jgi:UDP-N-acetyl-D-glucosamine dehydrogenase
MSRGSDPRRVFSTRFMPGCTYKGGIGDMRESPALWIIDELSERGAAVSYHDPFVPGLPRYGLSSVELDGVVAEADAVVLVTAHPGIDHHAIARDASLFLDLRGVTRGVRSDNIARL